MKGRLFFLFLLLPALFLPSCKAVGPAPPVTGPAETEPLSAPFWEENDRFTQKEGSIMQTDNDFSALLFSAEEHPQSFSLSFTAAFDTKANMTLYFDAERAEDGGLSSALGVRVDASRGSVSLFSEKKGAQTLLASHPIAFAKAASVLLTAENTVISVRCTAEGEEPAETAPLLNIRHARASKGYFALSCGGSTRTALRDLTVADPPAAPEAIYRNPLLPDAADPTAFYHDGVYYVFSTGTFACHTTTDLVRYKSRAAIADSSKLYGHKYFGGPTLYEKDGTFYMFYTTYKNGSDTELLLCVATSDNVTGPYTQSKQSTVDEKYCAKGSAGSFVFRDPSSGKEYLYWYTTEKAYGNLIYAAELTLENGVASIDPATITRLIYPTEAWEKKQENGYSGRVCERANVYYRNGYYYLFYAGSHFATSYGEGYAVSKSPLGPFTKSESNPILSATALVNGPGCTYIISSPDGSELFVLYHAHQSLTKVNPRPLYLDRLEFRPDPQGGADIPYICGPTVTPQPAPSAK